MQQERKDGQGRLVFCAYIIKDGKRIYPRRAKVFCFRLDDWWRWMEKLG